MFSAEIPVGDEQLAGVPETSENPTRIRIVIELQVISSVALWQFALQQHFESWDQPLIDSYVSPTIAQAALEAIAISNQNPDNNTIGIEVLTADVELLALDPADMTYAQAVDQFGETGIKDDDNA